MSEMHSRTLSYQPSCLPSSGTACPRCPNKVLIDNHVGDWRMLRVLELGWGLVEILSVCCGVQFFYRYVGKEG